MNDVRSATIIDGRAVAAAERERIAEQTAELARDGVVPGLAAVLVGVAIAVQAGVAGPEADEVGAPPDRGPQVKSAGV